jgi:hypothetical protein
MSVYVLSDNYTKKGTEDWVLGTEDWGLGY